jgi:hypothetical protein
MKKIIEKLNKYSTSNWEIRFHSGKVDINYPDSLVGPDYEDYSSLEEALKEVEKDINPLSPHSEEKI